MDKGMTEEEAVRICSFRPSVVSMHDDPESPIGGSPIGHIVADESTTLPSNTLQSNTSTDTMGLISPFNAESMIDSELREHEAIVALRAGKVMSSPRLDDALRRNAELN